MKGYKIKYSEKDGSIQETFFGMPITNIKLPKSSFLGIIKDVFYNAHPNCKILETTLCTYDDFMMGDKK